MPFPFFNLTENLIRYNSYYTFLNFFQITVFCTRFIFYSSIPISTAIFVSQFHLEMENISDKSQFII